MKYLFFVIIVSFLFQSSNRINDMVSNKLPTYEEAMKFKFGSKTEYEVYEKKGKGYYRSFNHKMTKGPKIKLKIAINTDNYRDFPGRQQNVKLENGYLAGFDGGEFGGSLYWFGNNGIDNYKICNGRIKDIILNEDTIFVMEGLSHLGSNNGKILELELNNGKWVSKEFLNLKQVPYAAKLNSKNELIVLTSKQLLKIGLDKKMTELISDGFWSSLYPNSSIILNDVVFFGMRNGLLKMDLNTDKAEWLTE
ncbi:hypothetical protein FIA58_010570 [Flavobacterium jejuense]|uniref:Glutamine cyclotransferase n=1 Tax=Flavobacterium jejuense TaxID=1544455 RepID=A0ABX0IQM0_9FLAO|nr:hypothetical protein [Flavobacterium jejuense]NHN26120.1 hypothetical protein [Flavobacterium jejuense]